MKYSMLLVALLSVSSLFGADTADEAAKAKNSSAKAAAELAKANGIIEQNNLEKAQVKKNEDEVLEKNRKIYISVVGQGVAPMNTSSPAQAYALAKRAAIADAFRGLAEKVKGVRVEGHDLIKNMMVQRSTIRTTVEAMVKNANIVETTFKEGLCEVEMEIIISYSDFAQ